MLGKSGIDTDEYLKDLIPFLEKHPIVKKKWEDYQRIDIRIKNVRKTLEYNEWRRLVLKRDNYQCVECGGKKTLQAHHIKPLSERPELALSISNGETLCFDCHSKKHSNMPIFEGFRNKYFRPEKVYSGY